MNAFWKTRHVPFTGGQYRQGTLPDFPSIEKAHLPDRRSGFRIRIDLDQGLRDTIDGNRRRHSKWQPSVTV